MNRLKPSSLLAQRNRPPRRGYNGQLQERRERPFDQFTAWIILRAVALGITLAVLLNLLIGYLARF